MRFFTVLLISALFIAQSFSQWMPNPGLPSSYFMDIIQRNDTLYAASYGNGVYKSVNGGLNWSQTNGGLSNSQALTVTQLLLTGNILYAATTDGIYKSTNAGASWVKNSNGIVVGGGAIYAFCESIFEYNGNLFTGAYTGIYRSTDGAENWIPTNISGSAVIAKNFTLHNGILFAARETNNSPIGYKSTDNGLNWDPITNISYFNIITFYSETGKLWAGTIDGAWLSTNSGASWIQRSSGLTSDPYSSSFVRVNGVLISSLKFGGSGIYKTTNDGLNWTNFGDGLPFLSSIEKLYVYNGKILAATSNGIWQRNINEIVTGVIPQNNNIPQSFELYQNYPNPFNPSTKIKFSIPKSNSPLEGGRGGDKTVLKIYDVLGKEIAELVNEELKPGSYEIEWNAANFPSGIYYYKLTAGDFFETKKMVLIK